MAYYRLPEKELRAYCEAVMGKYGFNEKQSRDIADILLTADLQGLESDGVQRLIRYHRGVKSGVSCTTSGTASGRITPLFTPRW